MMAITTHQVEIQEDLAQHRLLQGHLPQHLPHRHHQALRLQQSLVQPTQSVLALLVPSLQPKAKLTPKLLHPHPRQSPRKRKLPLSPHLKPQSPKECCPTLASTTTLESILSSARMSSRPVWQPMTSVPLRRPHPSEGVTGLL